MILALDLTTGQKKWNFTFPEPSKPLRTSTWSFSTPAYSNGKVVVGCMNGLSDNLFALDANNGSLLWNTTVGAIGKAAPVIYNDTVYVVSESVTGDGAFKKTMLNAVNLDDGGIRWQASLGRTLFALSLDLTYCLAQTTPSIANGTLYVTSPDGYVTAFDLSKNNTELWTQKIYTKSASSPILTSSPAYADGVLYVGAPDGAFHALSTTSNGTDLWDRQTFPPEQKIPVATDPIVSNGIVFFGDENGRLYVCGKFVEPNKQVNGTIISVPIELPQGFWWKKFYASMLTNASSSVNKITFSLLDADKKFIKTLTNRSNLASPNETLSRTLRLRADFWAKNSSTNPTLFLWNVSFFSDQLSPVIDLSTLTPERMA
jgi:outer membrane protein assembly factor BamB